MYQVYIPSESGTSIPVDAAPVQFENFDQFSFFVARSSYGWAVYETSTGMLVPDSESDHKQTAIDRAKESLEHWGIETTKQAIETALTEMGAMSA